MSEPLKTHEALSLVSRTLGGIEGARLVIEDADLEKLAASMDEWISHLGRLQVYMLDRVVEGHEPTPKAPNG